jgi:hypothetical protein
MAIRRTSRLAWTSGIAVVEMPVRMEGMVMIGSGERVAMRPERASSP